MVDQILQYYLIVLNINHCGYIYTYIHIIIIIIIIIIIT